MIAIDRARVEALMEEEDRRFVEEHPKSRELYERAKKSLIKGVPMSGMARWAGSFPFYIKEGKGAYVTDIDGHRYLDLALGDTPAMFGHTPKATIEVVREQMGKGTTFWLATEDSVWMGEELTRRFGLPYWQVFLTATDANQVALGVARDVTQRYPVLFFDGCYHGREIATIGLMGDEVWPRPRSADDAVEVRDGIVWRSKHAEGPLPDPAAANRVVQFNDLDAVERALSPGDVACVLLEPAMTNAGIILPDPGYHEELRKITRRYGTLLLIDETHTICGGPGGLTREWNLEPDIYTLGKPIAGGVPAAVMGISEAVHDELMTHPPDGGGIRLGRRTMNGNALSIAALRATLEKVMTEENFTHMISLSDKLADGVEEMIKANDLPWHVIRLGCRAEYRWSPTPPRNGKEAREVFDPQLHRLVHLFFLNREIMLTPPHSMVLFSPDHTVEDVDFHNRVFAEFVKALIG
jgi:glutamate-1-semialdehyde 2,1-aminomutase